MIKDQGSRVSGMSIVRRPDTGGGSGFRSLALEGELRVLWRSVCVFVCLTAVALHGGTARFVPQPGTMPLYFEVNRGQFDEPVDFVARGRDHAIYLSGGGAM